MAATPLYADPTQIPVGPSMSDNVAIRRILNLLNNRLGSALNAGNCFPLSASVDAKNFNINNLGGLSFVSSFGITMGFAREIWISASRSDNPTITPSGLEFDPL